VDRVGLQGRDEAIHVLSHVRASETAEVGCELFHAAVQFLVELIEDVLVEDAAAGPVAVRAVEVDVPLVGALLFPVGRVDELRVAVESDVKALSGSGGLLDRLFSGRGGQLLGDFLERHDLDGLAGGKNDPLDVLAVVGLEAHHRDLVRRVSVFRDGT